MWCFANKYTKHIKIITWSQTDYPSFIKRPTMCTKHDQHRAQSIQPSDMHTVGVHHVCHDIGRHVSYGSFFSYHWKLADIASEIFYYTVSTTVNCCRTRRWWQVLFSAGQHTGTSCMQHTQTAGERTLNFTSVNNGLQLNGPTVNLLIMRFRDSHNSMSISCKSTRSKKSSSDWLKSQEVAYSIGVKRRYFVFFCFTR